MPPLPGACAVGDHRGAGRGRITSCLPGGARGRPPQRPHLAILPPAATAQPRTRTRRATNQPRTRQHPDKTPILQWNADVVRSRNVELEKALSDLKPEVARRRS